MACSPAGYSPCGCKESDTAEWLTISLHNRSPCHALKITVCWLYLKKAGEPEEGLGQKWGGVIKGMLMMMAKSCVLTVVMTHEINVWKNCTELNARALLSHFNYIRLFMTPWTVACQAPLSMQSLQQEYWSGLSCPPPGYFPHPGIESGSPALQAESLPLSHKSSPTKCTPSTNLGKYEHGQ